MLQHTAENFIQCDHQDSAVYLFKGIQETPHPLPRIIPLHNKNCILINPPKCLSTNASCFYDKSITQDEPHSTLEEVCKNKKGATNVIANMIKDYYTQYINNVHSVMIIV